MAGGLHLEQYLDNNADQENVPPPQILPAICALEFPRSLRSALKGLESLPCELQRNFLQMRELDQQTQDLMCTIDTASDMYLKEVCLLPSEERSEKINKILKMFSRAKEYSDNKVHLAVQTYELVDKHIRRLDSDLAKFEAEVKEKPLLQANKKEEEVASKKKGRKKKEEVPLSKAGKLKKKKRPGAAASDDEELPVKTAAGRKKKKIQEGASTASGGSSATSIASVLPALSALSAIVHPSEAMDMPVDPNEPTYCLCHQVSYGEMIACDKADCPIEWFHFACVNLTTKPKGKWYCPRCSADVKKKK
ncbi:inhibitor of growth protein 5 isoform X2 [Hyalella azteca]|uniref:Inhibitor of growth protein n=1 Tax=Hyalella azteca TaxID=294128 RepID=A0A8B7N6H9_HYAAZ|nr:inhibitor of growth protein 5 isoform X2 [Hyalella azteca]